MKQSIYTIQFYGFKKNSSGQIPKKWKPNIEDYWKRLSGKKDWQGKDFGREAQYLGVCIN